MKQPIQIALDGHAGCGKSTLAHALATQYQLTLVDTGAMYRAVTLALLERDREAPIPESVDTLESVLKDIKVTFEPAESTKRAVHLNGRNVEPLIRTPEVAKWVSPVAAIPSVRQFLVKQQQALAWARDVILEGRDIGTVVLPKAQIKIFLTASPAIRAQRRYQELAVSGKQVAIEDVLESIKRRDALDTARSDSPLRPAEDAVILDNSDMTLEEELAWFAARYGATIESLR